MPRAGADSDSIQVQQHDAGRLVVRIPKSHLQTLEEIARDRDCSKSSIVRRVLSNFIEEETPQLVLADGTSITIEEARERGLRYPNGQLV